MASNSRNDSDTSTPKSNKRNDPVAFVKSYSESKKTRKRTSALLVPGIGQFSRSTQQNNEPINPGLARRQSKL